MNTTTRTDTPTTFDAGTDPEVRRILGGLIGTDRRVRLFLGDAATGLDWNEENDVSGTVSRSCGQVKVPLLIPNARSTGGGAILTHCVVRIDENGRTLWKHPKYHSRAFRIVANPDAVPTPPGPLPYAVQREETFGRSDFKAHAAFRTHAAAVRFLAYIEGRRGCK